MEYDPALKNVNGRNKAERIKTKAKKWVGLDLQEDSNKYFRVNPNAENKDVYAYLGNRRKLLKTKYGDKALLEPNNTGQIWVPEWAGISADYKTNGGRNAVLFKASPKMRNYDAIKAAAKGQDDLFHVNDLARHEHGLRVPKSKAFLIDLADYGAF